MNLQVCTWTQSAGLYLAIPLFRQLFLGILTSSPHKVHLMNLAATWNRILPLVTGHIHNSYLYGPHRMALHQYYGRHFDTKSKQFLCQELAEWQAYRSHPLPLITGNFPTNFPTVTVVILYRQVQQQMSHCTLLALGSRWRQYIALTSLSGKTTLYKDPFSLALGVVTIEGGPCIDELVQDGNLQLLLSHCLQIIGK